MSDDPTDLSALVEAGATIVFPEHLAAGLALAGQVLRLRGHSEEQAASIVTSARGGDLAGTRRPCRDLIAVIVGSRLIRPTPAWLPGEIVRGLAD
jgi:hypothetical protein